jgi:hypothetical protein
MADGMGTMSPLRPAARAALLTIALFSACSTQSEAVDLARNERLYADVPFTTKAPGDRPVFVAPVADARTTQDLPTQERGFPIAYGNDDVWERPVVEMVGEVLARQFAASGLFLQVLDAPRPDALVVKPAIVTFLAGAAESIAGSRSFAEVGVELQVFGPCDAAGKRQLLLQTVYANRQASEVGIKPISPYRLLGRALQASVGKALVGLDGSNVSRSQVPISVALPASAGR